MKSIIKTGVGFTWASTGVPGLAFVLLLACSKLIINLPVGLSKKGIQNALPIIFLSM